VSPRPHLELPPGWQAVSLDPADAGAELAAVRLADNGSAFTPNLTAMTHRTPAALSVGSFADRVLGRLVRTAERVAVFKDSAEAARSGPLDLVVVRGLRMTTRPESGLAEQLLVQFQVHVGVRAQPGDAEHLVLQLVLTCAGSQLAEVEPEFQSIVDNFGVEPVRG
jgi:hypothetical protein